MTYVIAAPEMLAAAASDLASIRSNITAANLAAGMRRREEDAVRILGRERAEHWQDGLPTECGGAPLYHILRMLNMYLVFDMLAYGKMRYNLLGSGEHWFPGEKVDKIDWTALEDCLKEYRFKDDVPAMLRQAHELFNDVDVKRLSESSKSAD